MKFRLGDKVIPTKPNEYINSCGTGPYFIITDIFDEGEGSLLRIRRPNQPDRCYGGYFASRFMFFGSPNHDNAFDDGTLEIEMT